MRQSLLDDTFNTAYAPFSYWTRALDMYTQALIDVDEQIGQLLENIPEALLDNMVVIFTSDHGEYASSHGLQGKGITAYEEWMRAPLPACYVEAQEKALRKYWGYVLLLDTASELVLKVGAP